MLTGICCQSNVLRCRKYFPMPALGINACKRPTHTTLCGKSTTVALMLTLGEFEPLLVSDRNILRPVAPSCYASHDAITPSALPRFPRRLMRFTDSRDQTCWLSQACDHLSLTAAHQRLYYIAQLRGRRRDRIALHRTASCAPSHPKQRC